MATKTKAETKTAKDKTPAAEKPIELGAAAFGRHIKVDRARHRDGALIDFEDPRWGNARPRIRSMYSQQMQAIRRHAFREALAAHNAGMEKGKAELQDFKLVDPEHKRTALVKIAIHALMGDGAGEIEVPTADGEVKISLAGLSAEETRSYFARLFDEADLTWLAEQIADAAEALGGDLAPRIPMIGDEQVFETLEKKDSALRVRSALAMLAGRRLAASSQQGSATTTSSGAGTLEQLLSSLSGVQNPGPKGAA